MSDTSRREAINVMLAQLLPYWMDEVDAGHARKMLLDGIDQALERMKPKSGSTASSTPAREDVTPYRPDGDQP